MFLLKRGYRLASFSQSNNHDMCRLSKWMSMRGICSRRQGLVRVDGVRIRENQLVSVDSTLTNFLSPSTATIEPQIVPRLWMINKPPNCICTHRDPRGRPTIYQLIPQSIRSQATTINSVGRLDYNSQGLLLLTNSTNVKSILQQPHNNLNRFYRVKVHGRVTDKKLKLMNSICVIKGVQYGPLQVKIDRELSTNVWLNISTQTGRNREIRRILQKADLQVNKIIRQQYGGYKLGSLTHGSIQEVSIDPVTKRKLKVLKKQKIRQISQNSSLIEIDSRKQAIIYAHQQLQNINKNIFLS